MDRVSIIAIEEVCKRCHLYTKHYGMLECPSQCVNSGHFIDGYRKAEKDLALTWEDIKVIYEIFDALDNEHHSTFNMGIQQYFQEALRRFNEWRKTKGLQT